MSTFTTGTVAGLSSALLTAHPGDTILLAPGLYSEIHITDLKVSGNITIQSQDLSHPAVVNSLYIRNSSGITFSNLDFSTVNSGDWYPYRVMAGSSNIKFTKLDVHGSVDGNTTNDLSAFYILQSSNVTISNSSFHDLNSGILHADSNNLVFSGNAFHDLQNHGIEGAGTSNIAITQNSFTNFYPQPVDHPDAIVFWTDTVVPAVHGISVTNNVISQGLGGKMQGIWLRDSSGGSVLTSTTGSFTDVTISGNHFYGTMFNGIGVLNANHVTISNNIVQGYADMQSWIRVESSDTVSVTNNQSQAFLYTSDTHLSESGNLVVGPANSASITGTAGSDSLTGTSIADTIFDGGGSGIDTMAGLGGDDVYRVSNSADLIIELSGDGTDTVIASVSMTLAANVENLTLTGTFKLSGTGNTLANRIVGNAAGDTLSGGAGDDTVTGGDGADVIIGGAGTDVLTGGKGNDIFRLTLQNGHDVINDFKANGDLDQLDMSVLMRRGYQPIFDDHGTYTTVRFATGDSIDLMGVHATDVHMDGFFLI